MDRLLENESIAVGTHPANGAGFSSPHLLSDKSDPRDMGQRSLERLSAAALKFSLQLDHQQLLKEIAVELEYSRRNKY